jgi:hypothetical protein
MLRRLCAATALLGAAAIVMTAGPVSATTTTVGQASGNTPCTASDVLFQTGGSGSYRVPKGHWTLSSWSTMANASGGRMALVVVRRVGSHYRVVFAGPAKGLKPKGLDTFHASLPVEGGDIIGFWAASGTNCARFTRHTSDAYSYPGTSASSKPSAGETFRAKTGWAFLMNISATLAPRP